MIALETGPNGTHYDCSKRKAGYTTYRKKVFWNETLNLLLTRESVRGSSNFEGSPHCMLKGHYAVT